MKQFVPRYTDSLKKMTSFPFLRSPLFILFSSSLLSFSFSHPLPSSPSLLSYLLLSSPLWPFSSRRPECSSVYFSFALTSVLVSLACSCNNKHHIFPGADSWECDVYWMDRSGRSAEALVCESSVGGHSIQLNLAFLLTDWLLMFKWWIEQVTWCRCVSIKLDKMRNSSTALIFTKLFFLTHHKIKKNCQIQNIVELVFIQHFWGLRLDSDVLLSCCRKCQDQLVEH